MAQARRLIAEYAPAVLTQTPTGLEPAGPVRTMRVRVWADSESRAGSFNFQARARGLLERANTFTVPGFRVRFELEDVRKWQRPPEATNLGEMLSALERTDAGEGVDLVIGMSSPLQIEATSTHQAGLARLLGRHMVLRPLSDLAEERAFREAFSVLDAEERDRLLTARRRHKEVVFFLHEWAHTMGGMHERQVPWLLHEVYSNKQGAFSYVNARLVEIGLRHRLSDAYDPRAEATEMIAFIDRAEKHADWSREDREGLLKLARSRAAGARFAYEGGQAGLSDGAPAQAMDQPMPPELEAAFASARDAKSRKDRVAVRAAFATLLNKMTVTNAPAAPPRAWAELADVALFAGALSLADRAIDAAGPALLPGARDLVTRVRRRYGLPRFEPPRSDAETLPFEQSFVDLFDEVAGKLAAGALDSAEIKLVQASQFRALPGYQALLCELAVRRGRVRDAQRRCGAALAAWDETVRAHLALGVVEVDAKKSRASGIQHLERTIALDPEDKAPWSVLADVLRVERDKAPLEALRARYREAFSEALP